MTYLFVVIGISVLNALSNKSIGNGELIFTNIAILAVIGYIEKIHLSSETSKTIRYEKIELIKPKNHDTLMADLKDRTGIEEIKRFEIGEINFLNDTAEITIFY